MEEIGSYKLSKGIELKGKVYGYIPKQRLEGDVVSGYHQSYSIGYAVDGIDQYAIVKVDAYDDVTWLLHELEGTQRFSSDDQGLLGMLELGSVMLQVNGQHVLTSLSKRCRWISDKKVIEVDMEDYEGKRTQNEVYKAYIAKHPSTITMTDSEMKSTEHTQKWVMDEIERRLWLNDKWLEVYANGKAEKSDLFDALHKNCELFLRYTNKYLGRSMKKDLEEVDNYGYLTKDLEGLRNKHSEFKAWWAMHKTDTPDVPAFSEVYETQKARFK